MAYMGAIYYILVNNKYNTGTVSGNIGHPTIAYNSTTGVLTVTPNAYSAGVSGQYQYYIRPANYAILMFLPPINLG